ncbi:MAG: hypothetical protein ACOH1S_05625 [Thermomonas sp.]
MRIKVARISVNDCLVHLQAHMHWRYTQAVARLTAMHACNRSTPRALRITLERLTRTRVMHALNALQ